MMMHADLLKALLPPVSYDVNGQNLSAELGAEGNALDRVLLNADQILLESDPRTTVLMLPDWERVYGLPDTPAETMTLVPGSYPIAAGDLATFSRASTATYVEGGLIKTGGINQPRWQDGKLLVEAQKTNIMPYSQSIDLWATYNCSVTANSIPSPDGTTSAEKLVYVGPGSTYHYVSRAITTAYVAGVGYCFSIFAKAGEYQYLNIQAYDSVAFRGAYFDLIAGAVTLSYASAVGGIQPLGGGWYRCWIAYTPQAAYVDAPIFAIAGPGFDQAYPGGTAGYGYYVFGAQMEVGNTPTTYIPTSALAAVTRSADVATIFKPRSVAERRSALVSKVTMQGGQSRDFFIKLAASLGYTITITELAPFTIEHSSIETSLNDTDWRFVWQVNAPTTTIREFQIEHSSIEEPLRSWGNNLLESVINRYKPAHTRVLFSYGG
jgi:uncharacterized protein YmfQ (DUF2313 family)